MTGRLQEHCKLMQYSDIPDYDSFVKIEPIDKGLSSDKKFYIETADE